MKKTKLKLFKFFIKLISANEKIKGKVFLYISKIYCALENFNYEFEENGELWLLKLLSKKESKAFLDVGANVGEYTSKLLELFPSSKIYSFEPSNNTFKKLKQNTSHYQNISIHNFALSNKSKTAIFYERSELSGRNTLEGKNNGLHYKDKYSVELKTGDQFINEIAIKDKISFIKIDVEGHELNVIKGFEENIKKEKIDIIQFERYFAAHC